MNRSYSRFRIKKASEGGKAKKSQSMWMKTEDSQHYLSTRITTMQGELESIKESGSVKRALMSSNYFVKNKRQNYLHLQ